MVCTTYNQVDYISRCLESLVGQETNFDYLVIVHDDASTDGTSEIVREYARRYPQKLVAILQEENIYSRGISYKRFTDPYLKSCKYVAFCEGDDWWDKGVKLQAQFDYMESHHDCSACAHNVRLFDEAAQRYVGLIPGCSEDRDYVMDDVIRGGGGLFGTNSLFYRVVDIERPIEYEGWGIGDYPTAIWLSSKGPIHCFASSFSSYRVNAKGSWTSRYLGDPSFAERANGMIVAGLEKVDKLTSYTHHDAIMDSVWHHRDSSIWVAIDCGFNNDGKRVKPSDINDLKGFLSRQTLKRKVSAIIKLYLPFINSFRLTIRGIVRNEFHGR